MPITKDRATRATRLRVDVLDAAAERLGLTTDQAKAERAGVRRETMWRYRNGQMTPSLTRALFMARVFEVPLHELMDIDAA